MVECFDEGVGEADLISRPVRNRDPLCGRHGKRLVRKGYIDMRWVCPVCSCEKCSSQG